MVNPETAETITESIISVLPLEVANQLVFFVQAIGGLFVLYLIFLGVRIYFIRNQTKMIRKMREDIKLIKKKLKIN